MIKMLVLYVFLLPSGQVHEAQRTVLFSGGGEFMRSRVFAMERCEDYAHTAKIDMDINLAELGTGIHLQSVTCEYFKRGSK